MCACCNSLAESETDGSGSPQNREGVWGWQGREWWRIGELNRCVRVLAQHKTPLCTRLSRYCWSVCVSSILRRAKDRREGGNRTKGGERGMRVPLLPSPLHFVRNPQGVWYGRVCGGVGGGRGNSRTTGVAFFFLQGGVEVKGVGKGVEGCGGEGGKGERRKGGDGSGENTQGGRCLARRRGAIRTSILIWHPLSNTTTYHHHHLVLPSGQTLFFSLLGWAQHNVCVCVFLTFPSSVLCWCCCDFFSALLSFVFSYYAFRCTRVRVCVGVACLLVPWWRESERTSRAITVQQRSLLRAHQESRVWGGRE